MDKTVAPSSAPSLAVLDVTGRLPGRGILPFISRALALAVALIGAWYLSGWMRGHAATSGLAALTMKTNAALCLLLLGAALAIGVSGGGRIRRNLVAGLAAVAALIGGLTLAENLFGWNVGIDQLLATEAPGAAGVVSPNRMGFPAASSFLSCGLAVMALTRPRARVAFAQTLALLPALLGMLATMGYFYQVPAFYGIARMTAIALPRRWRCWPSASACSSRGRTKG